MNHSGENQTTVSDFNRRVLRQAAALLSAKGFNLSTREFPRELPIIVFTIIVVFVFSIATDNFSAPGNWKVVGYQAAQIGIVTTTVTMVIILGGIDLSVGSLMAFVAAVVGILLNQSVDPAVACLAGLALGALCGLVNGLDRKSVV